MILSDPVMSLLSMNVCVAGRGAVSRGSSSFTLAAAIIGEKPGNKSHQILTRFFPRESLASM